ncbi:hypothetical protein [Azospirillum sp. TSO22-1]|uniref:hypothetical protein n=1 Tax=Azospirillum sp. TSO22-1 TaxID=716789 RepID=UPI000D618058|nr:hypothetical protein [Azospirillum sp. TSO22-1]PWC32062.1 hypothetical protein TSO221_31590 [Azospirillum sp. TSO22-1]
MTAATPPGLLTALGANLRIAWLAATVVASRPGRFLDLEDFRAGGVAVPLQGALPDVLAIFVRYGWVAATGPWQWRSLGSMPAELPLLLRGAADMAALPRHDDEPAVVLTRPGRESALVRALDQSGPVVARLHDTDNVFGDIARKAERFFGVAMPFVNEAGAAWIAELFALTAGMDPMKAARLLVVRDWPVVSIRFAAVLPGLKALGVEIVDYMLHDADGSGFETFHAKIVLADEDYAYVGSANTWTGPRPSMETGVRIGGRAARDVAVVLRAMQRVSKPITP